jgi:hypothetical protein
VFGVSPPAFQKHRTRATTAIRHTSRFKGTQINYK